jgi:hypothetical protein
MSRLRSARAGSSSSRSIPARSAVRPPKGGGVFVQTPKSDVYVALLGISVGALVLGFLFLILELNRYGFSTKPTASISVHSPVRVA